MFDFSGTLFRVESTERWLRGALAEAGIRAPEEDVARYAGLLERAGALPGGAPPEHVPESLAGLWAERDQDAERHRAAFTGMARLAALPWPELYDLLYDRHTRPSAWEPYPDADEVLRTLRARGVRVAVVSNIGWDLRPVLRAHRVDRYVDTVVLSYEHGIQKPDPRIFEIACEELALPPQEVLMVGDDRRADGGAAALGCAYHPVDHLPAARRPDGLRPVLDLLG